MGVSAVFISTLGKHISCARSTILTSVIQLSPSFQLQRAILQAPKTSCSLLFFIRLYPSSFSDQLLLVSGSKHFPHTVRSPTTPDGLSIPIFWYGGKALLPHGTAEPTNGDMEVGLEELLIQPDDVGRTPDRQGSFSSQKSSPVSGSVFEPPSSPPRALLS